jgi:hypothetical protein
MMQRWTTIALLGAVLVGCPTGSGKATPRSPQNPGPDACSATLPPEVVYDGSPMPTTSDDDIWVIYPQLANGETLAALVHTSKGTVSAAVRIPQGKVPSFVGGLGPASQAVFIGHPNPPPPVIDPHEVTAIGKRTVEAFGLARADIQACPGK